MPSPLIIKIDVTKLNKDWFFKGKSGTYCDLVLYYNDEKDQYDNDCSIKQNPPRSVKESDPNAKGHYVGNAKLMPGRGGNAPAPQQTRQTGGGYRKANVPPPAQGGDDWSEESIPFMRPHHLTVGGW